MIDHEFVIRYLDDIAWLWIYYHVIRTDCAWLKALLAPNERMTALKNTLAKLSSTITLRAIPETGYELMFPQDVIVEMEM